MRRPDVPLLRILGPAAGRNAGVRTGTGGAGPKLEEDGTADNDVLHCFLFLPT